MMIGIGNIDIDFSITLNVAGFNAHSVFAMQQNSKEHVYCVHIILINIIRNDSLYCDVNIGTYLHGSYEYEH